MTSAPASASASAHGAAAAAADARIRLLGVAVDPVDQSGTIATILGWCRNRAARYVVTPNLDHCVMIRHDASLRPVYEQAGLVLADGWPLVLASRLSPKPLRGRVTGSDLVVPLAMACAKENRSVFLLGGSDAVLAAAARRLGEICPGLRLAGTYSPPYGFERDAAEIARINAILTEAKPDVVFVALGAPKQERWMHDHIRHLPVGAALGIGASLDFLAGVQSRAPVLFQRLALEWLWRALSSPKRLGRRYLRDLLWLPILAAEHVAERVRNRLA